MIESQYQRCLEVPRATLGLMASQVWHDDPRRLGIVLARYKFVSKMLSKQGNVLEIGCADAFGTRVVLQEVGCVTAVDFDPTFIADVRSRHDGRWPILTFVMDLTERAMPTQYDAAYSIDVIEHIAPEREHVFLANLARSIVDGGTAIVGTPSLESQHHASPLSKAGHVNCKSGEQLRASMLAHFHTVFMFSMNDEVIHTGFLPMAHYLFAIGVAPRRVSWVP